MAIIVPHQSNQGISSSSGGASAQYQNPSAFNQGEQNTLRGVQELSKGINDVATVALQEELNKRQEQADFDALKDMQDFQSKSSAWHDEYVQSHKGSEARNAEQDAEDFLKENLNPLIEKWKSNPYAHKYIQSSGGQLAESLRSSARNHSIKQEQLYQNDIMMVEKANTADILSDPHLSQEEREKTWAAYSTKRIAYGKKQGELLEATQQDLALLQRDINFTRLKRQAQIDPQEAMRILSGQPRSLPKDVASMAERIAKENNISSELIQSIIATESAGNATAKSQKGAYGLMQLMPDTQKELEKKYAIDGSTPEGNVKLGTLYVKELLQKYKGDQIHALMAYNWGTGNVDSFMKNGHGIKTQSNPSGQIPFETKNYVSKVLGKDDENIRKTLSPEQRVSLTTLAEVAFADSNAESLYNDVYAKNLTELEAIQKITSIDNTKVRQATLRGLTERLRVGKMQERENIEIASIKAYDDTDAIIRSDNSDTKILSELHALMKDAEKKALTGTEIDKTYLGVVQKVYAQASSPLGMVKNSDPEEFLKAQREITYGKITTEKELKLAHPTLARNDRKRLAQVLASPQKLNLAEADRIIALFEGENFFLTKDKRNSFHAAIKRDIIDAAKENNPEWIKNFVAQRFIDQALVPNTLMRGGQRKQQVTANSIRKEEYYANHHSIGNKPERARSFDNSKEQAKHSEPKKPEDVPDSAAWDKKRRGWIAANPATGKDIFRPLIERDV